MTLDEAIKEYFDKAREAKTDKGYEKYIQLVEWLTELKNRRGGPWCPGCGSPVVEEGDACHSCKEGTHDPEDARWLNQESIHEIRRKEQAARRTHGFVQTTKNELTKRHG